MSARQGTTPTFDRSIVEGPLLAAIWAVAWPTILINIMGGLQGVVDHAMIGHFVGPAGNAAVGASWQIFLVVVVFVNSVFTGMSILISRAVGAADGTLANRILYQALLTAVVIAWGVLAPLGYLFSDPLLSAVHASDAVRAEATGYLRVLFLFSIGQLLYYMLGVALRAAGDARTPLKLGVVMTALNLVFNVILIPRYGTTGAGIGTVLASIITVLILFGMLLSNRLVLQLGGLGSLMPDMQLIGSLFRVGLPTGIFSIAQNVTGVLLYRFMGGLELEGVLDYGAQVQAVYVVCYGQLFSLISWTSFGLMHATSAVVGQSLGAKRIERATHTPVEAGKIGLLLAAAVALLLFTIPEPLMAIFGLTKDPSLVEIGVELMRFLVVSAFLIAGALIYTGALQGGGDTKGPLYITLISQVTLPLAWCFALEQTIGLQTVHIWIGIVAGHFLRFVLSYLRFGGGKWKTIQLGIESSDSG